MRILARQLVYTAYLSANRTLVSVGEIENITKLKLRCVIVVNNVCVYNFVWAIERSTHDHPKIHVLASRINLKPFASRVVRARLLHVDIPVYTRSYWYGSKGLWGWGVFLQNSRFIRPEIKQVWLVRATRTTTLFFPSQKALLKFSAQGCNGRPPDKAKCDCVHIHTFFIQWSIQWVGGFTSNSPNKFKHKKNLTRLAAFRKCVVCFRVVSAVAQHGDNLSPSCVGANGMFRSRGAEIVFPFLI